MPRYIDASPAQRFYQYTLPAAKNAIASNYKEVERQRIAALVAIHREHQAKAKTERDRKKANRRIRACLDEWKNVCRAWDRDVQTVAWQKAV